MATMEELRFDVADFRRQVDALDAENLDLKGRHIKLAASLQRVVSERDRLRKEHGVYRRAWQLASADLAKHQIGSDGEVWNEVALLEKQMIAEDADAAKGAKP